MADYPLKTLLGVRRREEELAGEAWVKAQHERKQAEDESERRADAVRALGGRLITAQASQAQAAAVQPASQVMAATRFLARLRDDLARAAAHLETYRRGPLASACAKEDRARQEVTDSRRAREALERHEDRFLEGQRLEADRRADEDNDENARVARHGRHPVA